MKVSELRIGSWVNVDGVDRQIGPEWLLRMASHLQSRRLTKPIPLDEDWLRRSGFEPTSEGNYVLAYKSAAPSSFTMIFYDDMSMALFGDDGSNDLGVTPDFNLFQYVHQLQNLFFSLTGEELKIK